LAANLSETPPIARPHVSPSENREAKIQSMRRLVGLRLRGQLDELMQNFASDCEMYMSGSTQFSSLSGRYSGREEIRDKMESTNDLFSMVTLEVVDLLVEGDDVAIRWKCKPKRQAPEASGWLEGMTVVKFKNDLVTYYGNYVDTAALQQLFDWD
jgi:ketosteroid isomerase-like protein